MFDKLKETLIVIVIIGAIAIFFFLQKNPAIVIEESNVYEHNEFMFASEAEELGLEGGMGNYFKYNCEYKFTIEDVERDVRVGADGVIVGSALINAVDEAEDKPEAGLSFVAQLRKALVDITLRFVEPGLSPLNRREAAVGHDQDVLCLHVVHRDDDVVTGNSLAEVVACSLGGEPVTTPELRAQKSVARVIDQQIVTGTEPASKFGHRRNYFIARGIDQNFGLEAIEVA